MINIPLFLSIKVFDTRSLLKHKRVLLWDFWTMWDKKLIAEKSDIHLLCVNFFHNRLFLKHRRILLRFFLVLWDKYLTKTCETAPLLLSIKIFDTINFSETRKGSATKFLGTVRQKIVNRKKWNPLIVRKFFWKPIFSETEKGCSTNFFGTARHRFWQKIVIHAPLLLSIKFFDTRSFLKHRRVRLRNV